MNAEDRVVVSYLSPGTVATGFCDSLIRMMRFDTAGQGRIVDTISATSGPRVAATRNMVVDSFLARTEEPAADWLLLVDSDMAFSPDTLEAFMAIADPDERPIVGGLAFRVDRFGRIDPCFAIHRPDKTGKFLLATPESFPTDTLLPVDATGAACLLVHRKVFEAVGEKFAQHAHRWFAEMQTEAGGELGEDFVFCLRARSCGFPIWIAPWIRFGHVKQYTYGYDDYVRYRAEVSELGEDAWKAQAWERRNLTLLEAR